MKQLKLYELTWPIFLETLLMLSLGFVDTFMLSKFSDHAAGAVGASTLITGFLNLIFMVVAGGAAVLISQYIGAKKAKEVKQTAISAIILNLVIGLILGAIMFFFGDHLLNLMNVTENLMPHASIYIKIVGGLIFTQALITTMGTIIRSHGYTKEPMQISLIMNILNVIGDAAFIFGPFGIPILGVKGVALATVGSRLIALILITILLFNKVLSKRDFSHLFPIPKKIIKQLLAIGLPSAGENISFNLTIFALTSILFVHLGESSVITRIYVSKIYMFALAFSSSIGQSTQIMVGQLVGQKKFEEADKTCMRNFMIGFIGSLLCGIALIIFRKPLISMFTSDAEIIAIGITVLLIDGLLEPGRSFNLVIISGLKGAGDVMFPVVIGIIMGWTFRIGVGSLFGIIFGWGLPGFFLAFLMDEWLRGIIMLLRWKRKKWMNKSFV